MRARRAGPFAAEALIGDRRGAVVSVHARAVNLLLEDGRLVALLPARAPLHPWALTLSLPARDRAALSTGAPARVAERVLEIGPLRIALAGIEVVDLRLARRLRAHPAGAARALRAFLPPPSGAGPFEAAIEGALERFGAGGDAGGLATLVGAGEGLTPSGDDVIVGALAGLDAAGEASREASPLRARLCAALETATSPTTRLAAQMLDAAVAGLYAEPVLEVLGALAAGGATPGGLERAVRSLLAMGHRSGADTLRGIVAALERVG
jgi:hypothetical protein